MKISFFAAENCFPSTIVGLMDVFTIANLWHRDFTGEDKQLFTTEIVTHDGAPVVTNRSLQFLADRSIDQTVDVEYIVIPPFIPVPRHKTPALACLSKWIIEKHAEGVPVAAMCTGTFLLAETGLLNGKTATTNWHFARKFNRQYPEVKLQPEKIMTEEDGLICTGAATSYLDFALFFIKRYGSNELATICSKALLADPNRVSQAPYFADRKVRNHRDESIAKAQRFMERNYTSISSVNEIADHVCISPRHFKRRFKLATGDSPLFYLQNMRIELAKKKLESTLDSIEEITLQIGYENASTFRRLFKKRTSLSPREYRDKFARKRTVRKMPGK